MKFMMIAVAGAINLQREPLLSNGGHFVSASPFGDYSSEYHPGPLDYFVPNFGVDKDIMATQKHIADSEKKLGHIFTVKDPAAPPDDYTVPNFGVDADILTTKKNLASAESALGHKWTV